MPTSVLDEYKVQDLPNLEGTKFGLVGGSVDLTAGLEDIASKLAVQSAERRAALAENERSTVKIRRSLSRASHQVVGFSLSAFLSTSAAPIDIPYQPSRVGSVPPPVASPRETSAERLQAAISGVWRARDARARVGDGRRAPSMAAASDACAVVRLLDGAGLHVDRVNPTEDGFAIYVLSTDTLRDGAHARYLEIAVEGNGAATWSLVHQATWAHSTGELARLDDALDHVRRWLAEVEGVRG